MVKEEREYVMLNECKLNNSCKSGNSLVNKYIDLNESLVKDDERRERVCYVE
jgi:hypothetical protein